MIFLTAEEADKVRGFSPSKEGHVLIPIECDDGSFKLGEEVLESPAFEHVRDFLAKLPRGEDKPPKALTEEEAAAEESVNFGVWSEEKTQPRLIDDGALATSREDVRLR